MASPVRSVSKLGFPWQTDDPFLFCVYHNDVFPPGQAAMSPAVANLWRGRNKGADFGSKDWNMYHGEKIPGFPRHPHRGFETVTVVRHGKVDHADGVGCSGRFGDGDVQWMTAGKGITHSEMRCAAALATRYPDTTVTLGSTSLTNGCRYLHDLRAYGRTAAGAAASGSK